MQMLYMSETPGVSLALKLLDSSEENKIVKFANDR